MARFTAGLHLQGVRRLIKAQWSPCRPARCRWAKSMLGPVAVLKPGTKPATISWVWARGRERGSCGRSNAIHVLACIKRGQLVTKFSRPAPPRPIDGAAHRYPKCGWREGTLSAATPRRDMDGTNRAPDDKC